MHVSFMAYSAMVADGLDSARMGFLWTHDNFGPMTAHSLGGCSAVGMPNSDM